MNDQRFSCRIKICGITQPDDAVLAAELGAWAIGLIFVPQSPRSVSVDRAIEIVGALNQRVITVGVFRNQPQETVTRIADAVGLDLLQLHGAESRDTCHRLGASRVIKALAWPSSTTETDQVVSHPARYLLFDHPKTRTTRPREADWHMARKLTVTRRGILVAGALSPENVATVVRTVQPFGVDVASGVESRPGIKNPQRLGAFFQSVQGCSSTNSFNHANPIPVSEARS